MRSYSGLLNTGHAAERWQKCRLYPVWRWGIFPMSCKNVAIVNAHLQGKTAWSTFLSIPALFCTVFWHGDAPGQGLSEHSYVASQGVSEDWLFCSVLLTTDSSMPNFKNIKAPTANNPQPSAALWRAASSTATSAETQQPQTQQHRGLGSPLSSSAGFMACCSDCRTTGSALAAVPHACVSIRGYGAHRKVLQTKLLCLATPKYWPDHSTRSSGCASLLHGNKGSYLLHELPSLTLKTPWNKLEKREDYTIPNPTSQNPRCNTVEGMLPLYYTRLWDTQWVSMPFLPSTLQCTIISCNSFLPLKASPFLRQSHAVWGPGLPLQGAKKKQIPSSEEFFSWEMWVFLYLPSDIQNLGVCNRPHFLPTL